jgi:nicotinamide phosphoribosyltransferase
MRGMSSLDSAVSSGLGHLLSFVGTDTIPAICGAETFYNANIEIELVGTSIPATEHSVMCANGQDEYEVINVLSLKSILRASSLSYAILGTSGTSQGM